MIDISRQEILFYARLCKIFKTEVSFRDLKRTER